MMEGLFSYFENHYIMFIILTVLMLFALIGYFAKKKYDKEKPYKLADENALAEKALENMAQTVNKNASIQDFMKHNATYQNQANSVPSQPQVQVQPPVQSVPQVDQVAQPQVTTTTSSETIDSI